MSNDLRRRHAQKGRGATFDPPVRFERTAAEPFDDGWGSLSTLQNEAPPLATQVLADSSRTVIAKNESDDVPFAQSINPYRGCEHGCIYCYARPSHAYLGLSPGLDFETRILVKNDAPALLERELARPSYRCRLIAMGTNTDPYQPLERRLKITRGILEVLARTRHPVGIVTKSAAVVRDLDLLSAMAADGLAHVSLSITTLDPALARTLEPRAAAPHRRLEALRALRDANVPTGVMVAPLIPGLNDAEIERILEAAAAAGATQAAHTVLRLPHEVRDLFIAWLDEHRPGQRERILALVRACRNGRLNDPRFGSRMRGEGAYAEMIANRVRIGKQRFGLDQPWPTLRTDLFERPGTAPQLRLF